MARRAAIANFTRHLLPPRIFSQAARSCANESGKPRAYLGFWKFDQMAERYPRMDFEHWFVAMHEPGGKGATEEQMIDCYVKTLAKLVGSEEEAKKRIYEVRCDLKRKRDLGFCCKMDWNTSCKIEELPGVTSTLPDFNPDPDFKGVEPQEIIMSVEEEKLR